MARERKSIKIACAEGIGDAVIVGGPWAFKIGARAVTLAATSRWGYYADDLTHVHSGYRFCDLRGRPERGIRQKAQAAFDARVCHVGESRVIEVLNEYEAKPAINPATPTPEPSDADR